MSVDSLAMGADIITCHANEISQFTCFYLPGKNTLKFHPQTSCPLHYQTLRSSLGQRTELLTAVWQRTHTHPLLPGDRKLQV